MPSRLPPQRRATRRALLLPVVLAGATLAVLAGARPAGASPAAPRQPADARPVQYQPPVDAPVADAFRPPAHRFGPGNRGLEYDTTPGDVVVASAGGDVVFAGPVAGAMHVTVRHDDGLRTSYSFLAGVDVRVGRRVEQGERLGTAGERLHFGVRAGDAYLDPASLFDAAVVVELLPFEVPPGSTPEGERRALAGLVQGHSPTRNEAAAAFGWLRDRAADLGDLAQGGVLSSPGQRLIGRGVSTAADLADGLVFAGPCSSGPPPRRPAAGPARRLAVTVGGLGSSSAGAAVDDLRTADLGYADGDVVRFSYAGGRTPGTGASAPALADVPARPYSSADTQGDVRRAAGRLADLVEQVADADPGATVDLYAHSLGGVVARLALAELERRGFDLARIGLVATLASPHGGADLAGAVSVAAARPATGAVLDAVVGALDVEVDPDAVAVAQLAPGSDLLDELDAPGVPGGVRLLSVAARGDIVVPSVRTDVAGAERVVVPVSGLRAHSALVGSDEATAEIARALAGEPPGCEPWHDVVADVVTGQATAALEDDLGVLAHGAP